MKNRDDSFQIGQVAQEGGVSVHTIRYYEKLGLLGKTIRSNGGFRLYSEATIEKLRFIKKAQEYGFTLAEIRQIMRESNKGLGSCCDYVGKLFRNKLDELEAKSRELNRMRMGLKELLKGWIPLKEAKKKSFAVCPQIENGGRPKRGGKRHAKKKS